VFVTVDNLRLYHEKTGAGPPLLFLHGFAQSSYCWRELAARLPGRRCVALDLKGFGQSDKPADGAYRVSDQARLVRGAIEALDLRDLVLVGHSLGGAVALATAAELQRAGAPPRGLVLVGSMSMPQRIPGALQVLRLPVLGELAAHLTPAPLAVRAAFLLAYHDRRRISAALVAEHARCMNLPGARAALVATARALTAEQIGDLAPELTIPALLLWGRHDPLVPLRVGQSLAAALPNARLEILEDCGHYPQQENPDETARLIREFLSALPPP
jgi:pimeloyl-ACP methyl ester carboxylesterase